MEPEDIKPGIEIIVAAGADDNRKLPYRLEVTHVNVSRETGAVTVSGRLRRLSGAPTQKKGTAAVRTATFSPAVLAKIRLAGEDELQPGDPIPPERTGGMAGFVVGRCGHRVAGSEWRAGFRNCERCGG